MSKRIHMFWLVALACGIALVLILAGACGKEEKKKEEVPATPSAGTPVAGLRNPFGPNDQQAIQAGKTIYIANCQSCHGEKGDGKGPAAAGLKPSPANFTSSEIQEKFEKAQGEIFRKVSEGIPGTAMPPWKNHLTETQRWQVITYEWSLSKK